MKQARGPTVAMITALGASICGCAGPNGLGWGDAGDVHRAAYRGNVGALHRALDRGEDPNRAASIPYYDFLAGFRHYKTTPIECAVGQDHPEAVEVLLESGASPKPQIVSGAVAGSPGSVPILLAHGLPPDAEQRNGYGMGCGRPLQVAAKYGRVDVGKLLIEAGADPNARDFAGSTALHDAAYHGSIAFARLLLAHGADPGARDSFGALPEDEARRRGADEPTFAEMIRLLQDARSAQDRRNPPQTD